VDRHLSRLIDDARRLGLPTVDEFTVRAGFSELGRAAFGASDGVIRLQHSRAADGRSSWLGIPRRLGDEPSGWMAIRAPVVHEGPRPWSGVKRSGALEYPLARDAARQRGADEALFADEAGRLIEGARSNLFLVLANGAWSTPDLQRGGVTGIARARVLEATDRFSVCDVPFAALTTAREVVAVNAVRGARPIVRLDGAPVGSPRGPALAMLEELLGLP